MWDDLLMTCLLYTSTPLLGIAADVRRCHIQIAAVGIHLVGHKILQMLRRKLGYVVQEGIQPQDSARHAAQPGEIPVSFTHLWLSPSSCAS